MEGDALCTIKLNAGSQLELHDGIVVEFNSPMKIELHWRQNVGSYIGTLVEVITTTGDDLVWVFTLDKEACHARTSVPEAPTVC